MIIIFYWKIDLCKMQYITLKKRKKVLFSFLDTLCDFYGWFHGGSTWGGQGDMSLPIILPNYPIKVRFLCPWPKKIGPLCVISWKNEPQPEKRWSFTRHFQKKVDLDLKMWTFYAWFSEKVDHNLKNVGLLWMIFWKEWTLTWNCGPFTHDFLKKVDLRLKNVDLHAWFSEKSGPWPENVDLLRMIFWKKWTSTWKCGPFMHDYLKKVDLNLKKCGPSCVIFWKMCTSTWKMWTFTHDFLKKSGPRLENVDLLRMIFWKRWTSTWKMWTFYAWFS